MLITQLKDTAVLTSQLKGKVFVIQCHGCREVHFPDTEVHNFLQELQKTGNVVGSLTTDYICNPENLALRLQAQEQALALADTVLVFSCGVGVQTIAEHLPGKKVVAGCDTLPLPGFQGVTPLNYDCGQCGQCYLNLTGGICPITACSKSLVNGQCGGAKNGMCEVDPNMECGWERIYRRLKQLGIQDAMRCPVQLRDYSKDPLE
jgi:electron transport complex protein RnfC